MSIVKKNSCHPAFTRLITFVQAQHEHPCHVFHSTSMAPLNHKQTHSPSPSPEAPPDQTAHKRLHSGRSQWLSIPSLSPSQANASDDEAYQEPSDTKPMHSTESADEMMLGMVFLSLLSQACNYFYFYMLVKKCSRWSSSIYEHFEPAEIV